MRTAGASGQSPKNLLTIMCADPADRPPPAARRSGPPAPRRRGWCCGRERPCRRSRIGQGRMRPTVTAIPRPRSRSRRGCGRSARASTSTGGLGDEGSPATHGEPRNSFRTAIALVRRNTPAEPDRDRLQVSIDDRDPIGVRAHREVGRLHADGPEGAEDLAALALDLLLLAPDMRNHVAQHVERRHAGVPAPDAACIVATNRRSSEGPVQRCEREREGRGGTVGVGEDGAAPPAGLALAVDQYQVIGVGLGNEEVERPAPCDACGCW